MTETTTDGPAVKAPETRECAHCGRTPARPFFRWGKRWCAESACCAREANTGLTDLEGCAHRAGGVG